MRAIREDWVIVVKVLLMTKTHVSILYAIYTRLEDRYTICFADMLDPVFPHSNHERKAKENALTMPHSQPDQE